MIKVVVSGAHGKMGQETCRAVLDDKDLALVGVFDPGHTGEDLVFADDVFKTSGDLKKLIEESKPDVLVDFSTPAVVLENIKLALSLGVHAVVGTTGVSKDDFQKAYEDASDGKAHLFVAPNFTTGAVLLMSFSKIAAKFFPDAEIIEFHHNNKKDAPSGTAVSTASMIVEARDGKMPSSPGSDTEIEGYKGARGAIQEGVSIHSVRSNGFVASQEVIFGSQGQTLTLRHDSFDRASYMPGVVLAIKSMQSIDGFVFGLEHLMDY